MRRGFCASLAVPLSLLLAGVFAGDAQAIQITGSRRLTSDPADQYNPVISGNVVVYTDTRAGNADIYLYNLETGSELNITNDPANQLLNDVHGDFVVYSDYRTGVAQVWAYYIPAATACRITYTDRPSLSPSVGGELLVFQDQNGTDTDVASFDLSTLDTTDFVAACTALETGSIAGPSVLDLGPGRQLSPKTSGEWVVYQGVNGQNQPRIYAYNRTTQQVTPMPENGKNQLLPDVDNGRVAYIEDDGQNRDVVFYDLATQTFIQVTADAHRQNFPSISGNFIAFEDSRAGNLDVYLYDLSTGALTPLTTDPANQYLNSIDGTRVVFTDASAANLDVVMVEFSADPTPTPEPCVREGSPVPIADTSGRTVIPLDDESLIVRREFMFWPFLHKSFVGGHHLFVDDHHRIVYDVTLPADVPQALVTLHAQVKKSALPGLLLASGLDSKAGLVLRANGSERRWDDAEMGVADLTLVATKSYRPDAWVDASVDLPAPRELRLPPSIAVTAGNGGNHYASLMVRVNGREIHCTYRGGSSQAHPHNASQRARGRWYYFAGCDDEPADDDDDYDHGHHYGHDHHDHGHGHHHHYDDLDAGDVVNADRVSLHVTSGDEEHTDGKTELTARLYAVSSNAADHWVDVVFAAPLPLFAGHNTITLEGPEYGSAYLKYKDVSFAGGGTLQAFARPACVADLSLIPDCHRADAEVLYQGTFVRHGGPIETIPYQYTTETTGPAVVCIANGDGDGSLRVSSAVVRHNGEALLGPSAFGANVPETAAAVISQLVNEGSVELRSTPGSYLALKIVRLQPPPQTPPSTPPGPRKPPRIHLGDCSASDDATSVPPLWLLAALFLVLVRRRR